ncbi:carbon-nitrogen hydrolase family protein [Mesorhizobium sp. Cs1299R1N1]|uniref:carbon-nitrogen hydrolase family protein n=1 Tax=Mesorhizobium sp. Cs1299R1N1 TaxID=3015172 RepID=UPI00301BA789
MSVSKIAAANLLITHDKKRNLAKMLEMVEEAAAAGVRLLVLPEMALQGYADSAYQYGDANMTRLKRYFVREAEPIPGPSTEILAEAARRHGMFIQFGLAERGLHGNVLFNAAALVGPTGLLGNYRKIHNLFEYPYFAPGEDYSTIDTHLCRVGTIICHDLWFPELLRSYALQGADMILMSTAWPMTGRDRGNDQLGSAMDLLARSNAVCNHSWLIISNHCGKRDAFDYYGGSQIVDPFGKVVAYLADDEGLVIHEADIKGEVERARTDNAPGVSSSLIGERRPEHYGLLADISYRHIGKVAPVLPIGRADHKTAEQPLPMRMRSGK